MTYKMANIDGRAVLVDDQGGWHDIERLSGGSLGHDPMELFGRGADLRELLPRLEGRNPDGEASPSTLACPVPAPRNVYAVGLNYRDHVAEASLEVPENPLVFAKFSSCVAAPNTDIELRSEAADYEAELVVVIGRRGRDIAEGDAWNHVFGLSVGQDISDRALQFAASPPHFDLGKSRDTYGPIGPYVVAPDSVEDPDALRLGCSINGEARQDGTTSDLIFPVSYLIHYISCAVTLEPGDVIFTGTPAGIGATQLVFLQPGDVIETWVEGVGRIRNECVA